MTTFWKIEEEVGDGVYFTHEGIFETRPSAEAVIARQKFRDHLRAVLYTAGRGRSGPVRVDEVHG